MEGMEECGGVVIQGSVSKNLRFADYQDSLAEKESQLQIRLTKVYKACEDLDCT
jgi:hypothetical protein